jgi:nitronate monooxygenase
VTILDRIGVATPLVQAGMGGGLSRHELAAAVSEAGGLGTIAVNGAAAIERQLAAARALTAAPLAVNLLLPFARPSWFEAASRADVVVTFWGRPRRRVPGVWIHQCGSVAEALAARAAGADAVIVQGVEAGGHVRGTTPALELLQRVRTALPAEYPLLLAGGIATRDDVRQVLEQGADGAVANAATAHWLGRDPRGPHLNRALNRLSGTGARFMPTSLQARLARAQRPRSRLLTPIGATDDGFPTLVDAGPLYAGESVARIEDVRPARDIVAALTP